MAYRFSGTDPFLRAAIGAFDGYAMRGGAPQSAFALVKRNATGGWQGVWTVDQGNTSVYVDMLEFEPSDRLSGWAGVGGGYNTTATFADTADWMIVGYTWTGTGGAGQLTWWWKVGAGAWQSEADPAGPTTGALVAGPAFRHVIGNEPALLDDARQDVACVGVIGAQLSPAEVQSLTMTDIASWDAVFAGPRAMLLGFDDITPRVDRTGNGADEVARSANLTLVADPAGFSWATAGGATFDDAPTGLAAATGSLVESYVPPTVYADAPAGAGAATGARVESAVYTASPTGTATPTGTAADALVRADAPTGVADPAGALVEAWARGFLDVTTGAATATGLAADALAASDAPTGTAAPSGAVVEAWARGLVDTPTGLALATGSLADSLARSESPSGAATPGGTLADMLAAFDAAIGIAAPSGSAAEAWGVGNLDAPAGTALATGVLADALAFADAASSTAGSTGAAIEAWAQAVAPTGAAQPHGSIVELWAGPPTGRVTFGGDVAFPDATGGLTPTGAAGSGSARASVEPT